MGTSNLVIVFLIAISHVTCFSVVTTNNTGFIQYALCTTDKCINTASEILANLNRTVDPCDNFYTFACGGWLQNNQPNDSFPYITILDSITRKVTDQVREFIAEPAKESDIKTLLKVKQIYAQCMDNGTYYDDVEKGFDADEQNNLFRGVVNRYLKWPLIMSRREWDDRNLTWQNVSDSLHETGFDNGLYDIVVQRQTESSNSNIIFITEPITLFPWNIAPNVKERYVSFIVTTAKAIIENNGGTVEIDILTQDVRDIVDFEKEMFNVRTDFKDNYISSNVSIPLTIQHFQEQYDKQHPENQEKIDWYSTIKKVFASEGIAIEPSEKIIVNKITYFAKL
ncbi:neprilysin-like, partial [Pseudomyrmex gracilis]|uniref:neprilysin-like n=1 Tax=Pseudomyrmex gracilis TaxID=219809 RepID=UPI0009950A05